MGCGHEPAKIGVPEPLAYGPRGHPGSVVTSEPRRGFATTESHGVGDLNGAAEGTRCAGDRACTRIRDVAMDFLALLKARSAMVEASVTTLNSRG